jgi:hypothetical protein
MGSVLDQVRAGSSYEEFAAHHNVVEDVSTLVVWFVDPALSAATGDVDVPRNQEIAIRHALESIHRVSTVDDCIADDIDLINAVVVDSSFHGWISVQLSPEDIRTEAQVDQEVIEKYLNNLQASYLRSEQSDLVREGNCTWSQAESEVRGHFSRDRKNVAFYHVIDELGINVWAQWDGPGEFSLMLPSVMNVLMEISCLDPRTNLIFMVVDDDGYAQTFGIVPQLNMEELAILYEQ